MKYIEGSHWIFGWRHLVILSLLLAIHDMLLSINALSHLRGAAQGVGTVHQYQSKVTHSAKSQLGAFQTMFAYTHLPQCPGQFFIHFKWRNEHGSMHIARKHLIIWFVKQRCCGTLPKIHAENVYLSHTNICLYHWITFWSYFINDRQLTWNLIHIWWLSIW